MDNPKAAQTVNIIEFQKLTTDERKSVVDAQVSIAVKKHEKAYKSLPNKLTLSPELAVHLKDSKGMTLHKKDYIMTGLYAIVVELDTDQYRVKPR